MVRAAFGILVLIAIAWAVGENRRKVSIVGIVRGLVVTFLMALVFLKIPLFSAGFQKLNILVTLLEESTRAGTSFVFGYLGGGPLPFDEKSPGGGFVFALQALPIVLVVSALSSLLYYWRILPVVVKVFAWIFRKCMGVGGAVGLSAASNVFLGMVESPLFVRPYLKDMTRSELFVTMSCGMAGVAGTVMVLYAGILKNIMPEALGHILIVSIITIPAAIMFSLVMIPETRELTQGAMVPPQEATGSMDAITQGTTEGVKLLINIISMLVVLVALVYLFNRILGFFPAIGGQPLTLQRLLGYLMAPIVWLIGIPWKEAHAAGSLMGTKTILNELIAYVDFSLLPPDTFSPKSRLILVYALCGFANLGSLGILIGGMGAMVPERRREIIGLGVKSIVSGTLSTLMAGAVVGMIM